MRAGSVISSTFLIGTFVLGCIVSGVAAWASEQTFNLSIPPGFFVYLSLGGGCAVTLAASLIRIMFFSSNSGYDEKVGRAGRAHEHRK